MNNVHQHTSQRPTVIFVTTSATTNCNVSVIYTKHASTCRWRKLHIKAPKGAPRVTTGAAAFKNKNKKKKKKGF